MKVEIYGHTDVGKKREYNEDSYLCLNLPDSSKDGASPSALVVVADGIGGHLGGDTASALAVATVREQTLQNFPAKTHDAFMDAKMMQEAIQLANHRIFDKASDNSELTGMGTTMVSVLLANEQATISNVGDSRAYLIRDASIRQVTYDHSWKAEQLRLHILTEAEIQESPFRHTITRSLGFQSDVQIDTFQIELYDDDYFLLCSDGLYESISEGLILKIIQKAKKPEKICHKLVKLANQHSGHDNITAVVARVRGIEKSKEKKPKASDTIKLDDLPRSQAPSETVKISE